ncbi:MAG: T9SS type A sorting domain-containing protein, partial [Candidatus Kapabacteria bacterium]|nr:T9SS type A sorting domain-containing protein [Candidatus Kapabacteria bacterium]
PINPFIYTDKLSSNAWEDINNDGMPDCLLSTNCECRTADVYIQNTPLSFIENSRELGLGHLADLRDILWLDFNNDGKVDLFCIENNTLHIYTNNTTINNNYVNIQLKSEAGSTSIGKVVKVYSGGNVYTKDVTSGRGLLIQDSPILHFGLGSNNKIDSVTVSDLNFEQKDTSLTTNRNHIMTIHSNSSTINKVPVVSVAPNPFTNSLRISVTIYEKCKASLVVYNINGQVVSEIVNEKEFFAGTHEFVWDAIDKTKNTVENGTYIIRLVTNDKTISSKVIKQD